MATAPTAVVGSVLLLLAAADIAAAANRPQWVWPKSWAESQCGSISPARPRSATPVGPGTHEVGYNAYAEFACAVTLSGGADYVLVIKPRGRVAWTTLSIEKVSSLPTSRGGVSPAAGGVSGRVPPSYRRDPPDHRQVSRRIVAHASGRLEVAHQSGLSVRNGALARHRRRSCPQGRRTRRIPINWWTRAPAHRLRHAISVASAGKTATKKVVIVAMHVATGATLGAAVRSRTAAALLGIPLHLAGDRVPHRDIQTGASRSAAGSCWSASWRFDAASRTPRRSVRSRPALQTWSTSFGCLGREARSCSTEDGGGTVRVAFRPGRNCWSPASSWEACSVQPSRLT